MSRSLRGFCRLGGGLHGFSQSRDELEGSSREHDLSPVGLGLLAALRAVAPELRKAQGPSPAPDAKASCRDMI